MAVINVKGTKTQNTNAPAATSTKVTPQSTVSTGTKKQTGSQKSTADVIKFDMSGIQVKDVRSDGSVVISVKAKVDPVAAIKNGMSSINVVLSSPTESKKIVKKQDPDSVLLGILTSGHSIKEETSEKKGAVIKETKLDVTSRISNKIAGAIANVGEDEARKLLGTETFIESKGISESIVAEGRQSGPETSRADNKFDNKLEDRNDLSVKNSKADVPVLDTPLSTSGMFDKPIDVTPRQLASDMLLKDGVSPALAAVLFSPIQETSDVLAGVKPGAAKGNDFYLTDKRNPADGRENSLVGSLIGGKAKDVAASSELRSRRASRDEATVSTLSKRQRRTVDVEKEIVLSPDIVLKAGNNFNITLNAQNGDEQPFQTAGCCFDLADRILGHLTEKKGLSATPDGKNVLPKESKASKDVSSAASSPKSTGRGDDSAPPDADVWVSTFSPFKPMNSEWVKKGEVQTQSREVLRNVKDSSPSSVVRFVKKGHSPPQPGFSEIVVQPHTRHVASTHSLFGSAVAETDNRFISVTTFLRSGGVTIRLSGFQSSYSVAVVRKDMTIKEKNFTIISVPQPHATVNETVTSLIFVDKAVAVDHTYEYRAKIFTKTGREILSTGSSLITYRQLVDNVVNTKTTDPILTSDISGELDVKFDVDVDVIDTNISLLTDILKSRGLDSLFTSDLEANRERLKAITSFFIERVDMTEGLTERFSLFKGGTFSDGENRNLGNVSKLKLNRDYRYVITVVAREADTLIPSFVRTVADTKTGLAYSYSPSKVLHPDTLRNGTIRAASTVTKALVEDEMLSGFIGTQIHIDVSTKLQHPKITSGNVVRNAKGTVDLRWKLDGDSTGVDHFVITCQKIGMKSIVGRTHAFSNNGSYFFNDPLFSVSPGDVEYFVIPVFSDMSQGDEFLIGTTSLSDRSKVI